MNSEKIKEELDILIKQGNDQSITNTRGRLIAAYRKEINDLLKKENLTDEEKEKLSSLKVDLTKEVEKHKIQLSARYSSEFLNKKANPSSIVTVLPNAISLAVNKMKTCIDDIKNAKDNKEKANKRVEALKSAGLLAATPVIYLGKFALDQWYVIAGIGAVLYYKEHPEKLAELGSKVFGNSNDIGNVPSM